MAGAIEEKSRRINEAEGYRNERIALARALLGRPSIVLLDDVLSAVDAHTESEILSGVASTGFRWRRFR